MIHRNYYNTTDLVSYFENLQTSESLPDFETLEKIAGILATRHATTAAFNRARNPIPEHESEVPLGSLWCQDDMDIDSPVDEAVNDGVLSELSDNSTDYNSQEGDVTLANATLLIRNCIWWREMCRGVAIGDTGRIWEILKVSIDLVSCEFES